jgi:CubicO group peptidase (beta-lactamase class C family)
MYGFSGSVLVARGGDIILSKGYGFGDREKGVDPRLQRRRISPREER